MSTIDLILLTLLVFGAVLIGFGIARYILYLRDRRRLKKMFEGFNFEEEEENEIQTSA